MSKTALKNDPRAKYATARTTASTGPTLNSLASARVGSWGGS